ncbi:MAG: IclR family transcriptional regulator [Alicyclobacillus sp.]|nr:IclR family transcriptional regulator [Alicyclobacillus sp.]
MEAASTSQPAWTIQSLARGLKLLELIAEQPEGCNAKWLSKVSGINLSTCYHLLNTLDVAGYVEKDRQTQNYVLTYKVSYLSNLIQSRKILPRKISTLAHTLVQKTGETAYVATWENGEVVVSHIAESDQAVKVRSLYVGYRDHAFVRALGKAILAHVTAAELMAYRAAHVPVRRTEHSHVDWDDIQAELQRTRERGYSLDLEEFELGVCCIGAPIFRFDGAIWGAMSISMPSSRYNPADETTVAYLRGEAYAASLSLGYQTTARKEERDV